MQSVEMSFTERGIYVIVERSLMEKITMLLSTIITSSEYRESYNSSMRIENESSQKKFITRVRELRKIFYTDIKKTSDIYLQENKKLVFDLYELFNNRREWKDHFILDYNIFWDYESNNFPITEIDSVFDNMDYTADTLREIVKLDYKKMKRENMIFAEELAKYVFNPKRIIKICEQYGLEDFYLKTKLFEIEDFVLYLDLLDP